MLKQDISTDEMPALLQVKLLKMPFYCIAHPTMCYQMVTPLKYHSTMPWHDIFLNRLETPSCATIQWITCSSIMSTSCQKILSTSVLINGCVLQQRNTPRSVLSSLTSFAIKVAFRWVSWPFFV